VGRKIGILAALLCFVLPLAASAQEQQQSLGDLARQLRKEKEKNSTQPKTVITDDSLPGKSGGGLNLDSSADAQTFTGGNSEAMDRAWAGLNRADAALNLLEPMDRATLAKFALAENDRDVPGRREWEDKLYSAKQSYISHARELIHEMRDLLTKAQALRSGNGTGKISDDDPSAKEIVSRAQQLMQDAFRTQASLQAVVLEGQDLAKRAATH
jgi:hypothetical protein